MPNKRRPSTGTRLSGKIISESALLGQRGVNLIEKIVLEMGYAWYPTGQVEAGIDGYIEIRDPKTGEATNCIILVQSRATSQPFANETAEGFDYYPDERDLHYWLFGNAPVVLVRSRPGTGEAYWVSIKDYFSDQLKQKPGKIHFDKLRDSFGIDCRQALIDLAVPRDAGLYIAPLYRPEKVYTNLLPVASFPDTIYVADTDYRYASDVWAKFKALGVRAGGEWILKSGKMISLHDLRQSPWNSVCDGDKVWPIDSSNWANSTNPATRYEFIDLLQTCLRGLIAELHPPARYFKVRDYYHFLATKTLSDLEWSYPSIIKKGRRKVFLAYADKKDPGRTSYYRHCAFRGHFVRYGGKWHLEINPTYHYTSDGKLGCPFGQDLLGGIKGIERNHSVIGQVVMWAAYLTPPRNLLTAEYPFLSFDPLLTFDSKHGIDDEEWLRYEDEESAQAIRESMEELPLLGLAE